MVPLIDRIKELIGYYLVGEQHTIEELEETFNEIFVDVYRDYCSLWDDILVISDNGMGELSRIDSTTKIAIDGDEIQPLIDGRLFVAANAQYESSNPITHFTNLHMTLLLMQRYMEILPMVRKYYTNEVLLLQERLDDIENNDDIKLTLLPGAGDMGFELRDGDIHWTKTNVRLVGDGIYVLYIPVTFNWMISRAFRITLDSSAQVNEYGLTQVDGVGSYLVLGEDEMKKWEPCIITVDGIG